MNMGNYFTTKTIKTANAATSTDEDNEMSSNSNSPKTNEGSQSEPSGSSPDQETQKSKSPSVSGSVSDTNVGKNEDDNRNTKGLHPNQKRTSSYKRKLAESSESSDDGEESLQNHEKNLKGRTNLKKHQVPQPKLPKIITHKNQRSE